MDLNELVGSQVRAFRKKRGLSLIELCETLDEQAGVSISKPTLIRLEQGQRPVTVAEVAALALVLVVPPSSLLTPLDRPRERVTLAGDMQSTVSRTYYWWVGLEAPTNPSGYRLTTSHSLAYPEQGALYEAALKVHVTQGLFLNAHRKLVALDSSREMAEDPAFSKSAAPSDDDYLEAHQRIKHFGKLFVEAIRDAHVVGLPPYRVHPDYWPYLAGSVGRTDAVGWAHDEGIEPYDPEDD